LCAASPTVGVRTDFGAWQHSAMASPIIAIGSKVAIAIATLGVLVVCSGGLAYFIARRYGRSRPARKVIFTAVGGVGLIASTFVLRAMLR
jgi:hypothetical protein